MSEFDLIARPINGRSIILKPDNSDPRNYYVQTYVGGNLIESKKFPNHEDAQLYMSELQR